VAKLLVAGVTLGKVAAELGISTETVRSHVKAIYDRLDVTNRIELSEILREQ
jgi:DNA-binding NarL/FixJ family response regulator